MLSKQAQTIINNRHPTSLLFTWEQRLKANSEPLQGQNVQKAQAKMATSEANWTGILEQLNHEPEIEPKVSGDAMVTMHSARPEMLS